MFVNSVHHQLVRLLACCGSAQFEHYGATGTGLLLPYPHTLLIIRHQYKAASQSGTTTVTACQPNPGKILSFIFKEAEQLPQTLHGSMASGLHSMKL